MQYKTNKQYRLPNYDYSQNGCYFVTVCTKDKQTFFGDVVYSNSKTEIYLSPIGEIVKSVWVEIPSHFPAVTLDEWIVMPNHMHGIIVIENFDDRNMDRACPVPTENSTFGHVAPQSLSTIIGSFKSAATRIINRKLPDNRFAWQGRFYDHVIRNEESLMKIREYIRNNPLKWELDRNVDFEEQEIVRVLTKRK